METTNTRVSGEQPAQAEAPRPYLMVISGARPGELHTLRRERTVVGRSPDAGVRLGDVGVSREHAELRVDGGRIMVADLGSTNGTFVNGVRVDRRELQAGDQLSIGEATLLLFTHSDGIEAGYQRGRFQSAVRDRATHALRREVFLERLREELSFARRRAAHLVVLAWEVDDLATLEARLGRPACERWLASMAKAVKAVLRDEDVLGALGPGRLVVACPKLDLGAGRLLATRVRAAVAGTPFEGAAGAATASVGLTAHDASNGKADTADTMLDAAARGLDAARADGGDRVEVETPARGRA